MTHESTKLKRILHSSSLNQPTPRVHYHSHKAVAFLQNWRCYYYYLVQEREHPGDETHQLFFLHLIRRSAGFGPIVLCSMVSQEMEGVSFHMNLLELNLEHQYPNWTYSDCDRNGSNPKIIWRRCTIFILYPIHALWLARRQTLPLTCSFMQVETTSVCVVFILKS